MGESFASRVAGSLLNSIGLPELIAKNQEEYEAIAVGLAKNSTRLQEIKGTLARNRLSTPLFNAPLFTKHIEDAYRAMYARYEAGLLPEYIYIDTEAPRASGP
jgi:predicted O-linked N-acetylglucosamine transferase (SPINDLY family)